MIQFNILKFLTKETFQIAVQVMDLNCLANVYIDKIIIDTDLNVKESGPSDSPVFEMTVQGDQKAVSFSLNAKDLMNGDTTPRMFFVYVKTKGTPGPETPCGLDKEYSVKAVADLSVVYNKAIALMKCGKGCGCTDDECLVSTKLANLSMEYYKLTTCIELGMNTEALESFNRLMGRTVTGTKVYTQNCGCNDN